MPPKKDGKKDGKGKGDKKQEEPIEEKLGKEVVVLEAENVDLGLELCFVREKLKNAIASNQNLEKDVDNLKLRVANASNEYQDVLAHQASSLSKNEQRLQDLQKDIDGLNHTLIKKNEELQSIKEQLASQDGHLKDATGMLTEKDKLEDTVRRNHEVIEKQTAELKAVKRLLEEKESALSTARDQIMDLTLKSKNTMELKILFDETWLVQITHMRLKGDQPWDREGNIFCCLAGGRLLLLHGGSSGRSDEPCSNELCVLNMDHLVWERPAQAQEGMALSGHTDNTMSRTKTLMFGGIGRDGLSSSMITFNTESMKWMTLTAKNGALPPSRSEHASCILREKLYIFGGMNAEGELLDDFWVLDLDTMLWSQVITTGIAPSARKGASLCTTEDGRRVYLFGGFDGTQTSSDVFLVDVDQIPCAWAVIQVHGSSLEGREGHTTTILGKYLLVAGGVTTGGAHCLASTYVLNLNTSAPSWECLDDGSWASNITRLKPFSKYMCFYANKLYMLKPSRDDKLTELQVVEVALPEDIDRLRNQKKRDMNTTDKLEVLENAICTSKFIEVSWRPPTKNSGRISRFKLMISNNTGMVQEAYQGPHLRFKAAGLKANTEYIFCVKAIYDDGSFLWSESKAFWTNP